MRRRLGGASKAEVAALPPLPRKLRRELERIAIPGEDAAEARARAVVQAAFAERLPSPPTRRRRSRLLALPVAAVVVLAVAVSPAGPSLLHSVRAAVGLRGAAPALVRLPASGRLLVDSSAGPWIVAADGSKRLLGRYASASWSPHGLFEVAVRGHELTAVDPKGNVRWSLEREGAVRDAAWSPDGYRIAYLDGSSLRVVAGDGTGDHLVAHHVAGVKPAWRPGNGHVLAYVAAGTLHIANADTGAAVASARAPGATKLQWSQNGNLLVTASDGIRIFGPALSRPAASLFPHATVVDAAWHADRLAVVLYDRTRNSSTVLVENRVVFTGTGRITAVTWAPDGRWLVLAWPTAGQWVFAQTGTRHTLRAVASISAQFHSRTFPQPVGWCC